MTLRSAAVIPAFNEGARIAAVVAGVRAARRPRRSSSTMDRRDGTAERARAAGAEVIVHDANRGKGHAVRTGLARVFEGDFTHVLLLDGDMQHLPDGSGGATRRAARSGAEAVLGERRFERDRMPASRYHANRIGSRVLSWFVGVPLTTPLPDIELIPLPLRGTAEDTLLASRDDGRRAEWRPSSGLGGDGTHRVVSIAAARPALRSLDRDEQRVPKASRGDRVQVSRPAFLPAARWIRPGVSYVERIVEVWFSASGS